MRSFKLVFGLIATLLPVGYCGYLLLYFRDVSGDAGPVATDLSPTMLGLGAVGLLLGIPVLLKIVKLFAGASAAGGREIVVEESSFDPDAALARYLARKAAGALVEPPLPPLDAAPRTGFGRKPV